MIILKDRFDPVLAEHMFEIKRHKKIGVYIEDTGIVEKKARIAMVKKAIAPYRHAVIVDKIMAEDEIISLDLTKAYEQIYQGELYRLAPKIRWYILKRGLYLDKIVENHNHGKRLAHVHSMCALALQIARWHHVDEAQVKICALMHDIYKQADKQSCQQLMAAYFPQYVAQDPALYHQYLGAWFMRHRLGINDRKMYEAIMYHTTGEKTSQLAMIIFIADKLDPSRGYDVSHQLAVVKNNLKAGFELVKKEQIAYITKVEGKQIGITRSCI